MKKHFVPKFNFCYKTPGCWMFSFWKRNPDSKKYGLIQVYDNEKELVNLASLFRKIYFVEFLKRYYIINEYENESNEFNKIIKEKIIKQNCI